MTKRDDRFQGKANRLELFVFNHHCYPSFGHKHNRESRFLGNWVAVQRRLHRQGKLAPDRVTALKSFDPLFFSETARGRRVKALSWDLVATTKAGAASSSAIKHFTDHQGRPYVTSDASIARYMVKCLDISDVCPSSCNPDSPFGSIQRVLSFALQGSPSSFRHEAPLSPSWSCHDAPVCKSLYFSGASLYVGEGKDIMDKAEAFVPALLIKRLRVVARKTRAVTTALALVSKNKEMARTVIAEYDGMLLDTFHYGKTGRFYKEIIPINKSTLPQPRRITMSVTITPPRRIDADTGRVQDLYSYSAAGRPPPDWRSRPMPPTIAALGEYLWKTLWHHLSPASQVCPPTGCQLLLYSSSLKSLIHPHKDNGIPTDNGKQTRTATDKSLNSHIIGTSVIVFSLFDEMEFGLLTPKPPRDFTAPQAGHEWNPVSTVNVGDKSAYILDPNDDENYMHAVRYAEGTGPGRVRVAMVFRWLSQRCPFYIDQVGPLQHALHKPDAVEALERTKTGPLWMKALGLK
jgi:hypothetical protein